MSIKDIEELKEDELPIFKTSDELANMRIDRFTVPQASFYQIKEGFVLPRDHQSKTIEKLVDSRPDWLELEEEEQLAEIKLKLILETVAQYLYTNDYIGEDCTMYDNGFDEQGNILLSAYYVKETTKGKAIKEAIEEKKQMRNKPVVSLVDYKKRKEAK